MEVETTLAQDDSGAERQAVVFIPESRAEERLLRAFWAAIPRRHFGVWIEVLEGSASLEVKLR